MVRSRGAAARWETPQRHRVGTYQHSHVLSHERQQRGVWLTGEINQSVFVNLAIINSNTYLCMTHTQTHTCSTMQLCIHRRMMCQVCICFGRVRVGASALRQPCGRAPHRLRVRTRAAQVHTQQRARATTTAISDSVQVISTGRTCHIPHLFPYLSPNIAARIWQSSAMSVTMNVVAQGPHIRARCVCVCVSHKLDIGSETPAIGAIAASALAACALACGHHTSGSSIRHRTYTTACNCGCQHAAQRLGTRLNTAPNNGNQCGAPHPLRDQIVHMRAHRQNRRRPNQARNAFE